MGIFYLMSCGLQGHLCHLVSLVSLIIAWSGGLVFQVIIIVKHNYTHDLTCTLDLERENIGFSMLPTMSTPPLSVIPDSTQLFPIHKKLAWGAW